MSTLTQTDKSILVQVSYKGQIEREKSRKRLPREKFEQEVWEDYQSLKKLVERAIDDYVDPGDLAELEELIHSSTLDEDQRIAAEGMLRPDLTKANASVLKTKLLNHQQDPISEVGAGRQKDIKKKLDKK